MTTWIILRAAGIGAYLMLFMSVAWGLIATTSVMGKRVSKASAVAVHQFMASIALVLLGIHLGGVLLDRFVPFHPLDVVIPLHSTFRPMAVAFGIAAMYLAVVVVVSSWMRKRVGTTWWRRLHVLAAPAFTLSMVHGIFSGTDTIRPWMWWIYVTTGGIVLFLLVVRALTVGLRPERATRPALPTPVPSTSSQRSQQGAATRSLCQLAAGPFESARRNRCRSQPSLSPGPGHGVVTIAASFVGT